MLARCGWDVRRILRSAGNEAGSRSDVAASCKMDRKGLWTLQRSSRLERPRKKERHAMRIEYLVLAVCTLAVATPLKATAPVYLSCIFPGSNVDDNSKKINLRLNEDTSTVEWDLPDSSILNGHGQARFSADHVEFYAAPIHYELSRVDLKIIRNAGTWKAEGTCARSEPPKRAF